MKVSPNSPKQIKNETIHTSPYKSSPVIFMSISLRSNKSSYRCSHTTYPTECHKMWIFASFYCLFRRKQEIMNRITHDRVTRSSSYCILYILSILFLENKRYNNSNGATPWNQLSCKQLNFLIESRCCFD